MSTITDDTAVDAVESDPSHHPELDEEAQATDDAIWLRTRVTEPPRGRDRIRWWGPGLLWAMSSVGSGSVLFTPRVGSEYGYELLWLLLGVAFLMWVMIREAGRFAVLTGRTLLDGFRTLPGPRNWALWVVFVPQLLAAVVGVGGLSALVGSALAGVLPGSLLPWALAMLATSTVLVVSGGYSTVSRVALVLALGLVGVAVAAATQVLPDPGTFGSGLVPGVPSDLDVPFVLPWIGTILAGIVGVSNIMLISVRERTKEIGVRKALGATPSTIVRQIVMEALVITGVSGYVGLVLGLGMLELVTKYVPPNDYFRNPEANLSVVIGATVLLVISGVLAGYFPARLAARINPVEALRAE